MRILISLSRGSVIEEKSFGPAKVVSERTLESNLYTVTWLNKMTNNIVRFIKASSNDFVIEIKNVRAPAITYQYTDLRDALMTFLVNLDLSRMSETLLDKCKKFVGDLVKGFEKRRTLNINLKETYKREHKALNTPVLIGNQRDQKGIMIGINWAGSRAKVALLDESGEPTGKIVELDTKVLWLP